MQFDAILYTLHNQYKLHKILQGYKYKLDSLTQNIILIMKE